MATYIMLANWTDQGARNVRDSPRRLDAAKKLLQDMGGDFRAVFLTMGDYDLVSVLEAPDDQAVAKFLLSVGALGSVRTTTLKAFPEAEYRDIMGALA